MLSQQQLEALTKRLLCIPVESTYEYKWERRCERWYPCSPMTRKNIGVLTGLVPHQENPYDGPQSQERTEHTSHTASRLQGAAVEQAMGVGSSGCTDGAVLLSGVYSGWSHRG
jgi:hypothetical protein